MKIVSLLQVKLPLVCDIMCTMDIFLLALPMFIMVGLSIHMFTRAPSPHFNPFPVDDDYIGHNGLKSFLKDHSKAESFYYVKYGSTIINYCVKSQSNNLSNENINIGVSDVFKTKCELKCRNELILKYVFSGNTSIYFFITEFI